jgi:hypothetical protein
MDKVIFPAAYGKNNEYITGLGAKKEIKPYEAFMYVPGKLLITVEKARASEIGHIFNNHDTLFKSNADRDFLTLLVYMIYEY